MSLLFRDTSISVFNPSTFGVLWFLMSTLVSTLFPYLAENGSRKPPSCRDDCGTRACRPEILTLSHLQTTKVCQTPRNNIDGLLCLRGSCPTTGDQCFVDGVEVVTETKVPSFFPFCFSFSMGGRSTRTEGRLCRRTFGVGR